MPHMSALCKGSRRADFCSHLLLGPLLGPAWNEVKGVVSVARRLQSAPR